jgi:predicted O-methyltransferase YrrM
MTDEFFESNFQSGIDFAFIDGSHTYQGALLDMMNIYKRMNVNGVMVVDDFRSGPPNGSSIPDVDRAVEDFEKATSCRLESWSNLGKGFAIFRHKKCYRS